MVELTETEKKICRNLHDFIGLTMPDCLVDEDDVFIADSLEAIGEICFRKAVTFVDGATEELLKIVLRSIFYRKDFNTEQDYYRNLLTYMRIERILKPELIALKSKYDEIFLVGYPAVLSKIQTKIGDIETKISSIEQDANRIISRNNSDKSILKDLEGNEMLLSEKYRKINQLRTENEMLAYSRDYITQRMESFCDLSCNISVERKLRRMAVEKAQSSDAIVDYSLQYYQDIIEITDSNIRKMSAIFFKIKLFYTVEQIKRKYNHPSIELKEEALCLFKSEIDALPTVSDLMDSRNNRVDDYSHMLCKFLEEYGIFNSLSDLIEKTISIQNRKAILLDIMSLFEQGKYELFINALPIQIEGLFDDYLNCGTIYKRFTDLALYPNATLRGKLDVSLVKMSEISPDAVHYFKFYFNNIIRNKVAHGVDAVHLTGNVPLHTCAVELLLDLNFIVYLISKSSEAEKMYSYVTGFFLWTDKMGKDKDDFAYGCLYNDLIGVRIHSGFESIERYNPIQLVYWMLNPYYEHLYKRLNDDISALIRLRGMLLSNGFWEFVYGKLSEESIFTDRIDRKLHSIVKALFNCGINAETKKTLADVDKKLHELSVT